MPSAPLLEVLISTKGGDGIKRIASSSHPSLPGVRYVVSWQEGNPELLPESLAVRPDFKIIYADSVGLSKNRNNALKHSEAPIVLISDDDLEYSERHLENVISAFSENPDLPVLTFRYESSDFPRLYPSTEFDLNNPPKGYFAVSFEIALNLKRIKEEMDQDVIPLFNENFGLGAMFGSGEEDLLINNLMRSGLRGKFVPRDVCIHKGPTTGIKEKYSPGFIQTQGAVVSHLRPVSWPLRLFLYALRHAADRDSPIGFFGYISQFIKGVVKAKRNRVFTVKTFSHK